MLLGKNGLSPIPHPCFSYTICISKSSHCNMKSYKYSIEWSSVLIMEEVEP